MSAERPRRGAARRKLGELLVELGFGDFQVGFGDRLAVDRGNHGIGLRCRLGDGSGLSRRGILSGGGAN